MPFFIMSILIDRHWAKIFCILFFP